MHAKKVGRKLIFVENLFVPGPVTDAFTMDIFKALSNPMNLLLLLPISYMRKLRQARHCA